jgi:hypothetical protein
MKGTGNASLTSRHRNPADCFPQLESWCSVYRTHTRRKRVLDHGEYLRATCHHDGQRDFEVLHHCQVVCSKASSLASGTDSFRLQDHQPSWTSRHARRRTIPLPQCLSNEWTLDHREPAVLPSRPFSQRSATTAAQCIAENTRRRCIHPPRSLLSDGYPLPERKQCCLQGCPFSGLRGPPATPWKPQRSTRRRPRSLLRNTAQEEHQELGQGRETPTQRFGHASESNTFITSAHPRGLASARADSPTPESIHLAACADHRLRHGSRERRHDDAQDSLHQTRLARGPERALAGAGTYHRGDQTCVGQQHVGA